MSQVWSPSAHTGNHSRPKHTIPSPYNPGRVPAAGVPSFGPLGPLWLCLWCLRRPMCGLGGPNRPKGSRKGKMTRNDDKSDRMSEERPDDPFHSGMRLISQFDATNLLVTTTPRQSHTASHSTYAGTILPRVIRLVCLRFRVCTLRRGSRCARIASWMAPIEVHGFSGSRTRLLVSSKELAPVESPSNTGGAEGSLRSPLTGLKEGCFGYGAPAPSQATAAGPSAP